MIQSILPVDMLYDRGDISNPKMAKFVIDAIMHFLISTLHIVKEQCSARTLFGN